MAPKTPKAATFKIGAVVSPTVKRKIESWSQAEGRSERSHVAILIQKLVHLREERPDEMSRLGLMDPLASHFAQV